MDMCVCEWALCTSVVGPGGGLGSGVEWTGLRISACVVRLDAGRPETWSAWGSRRFVAGGVRIVLGSAFHHHIRDRDSGYD